MYAEYSTRTGFTSSQKFSAGRTKEERINTVDDRDVEFDPKCHACVERHAEHCTECHETIRTGQSIHFPTVGSTGQHALHRLRYRHDLDLSHAPARSEAGDSVVSFDETCEKCAEENLWCDTCRAFALEYDPLKFNATRQRRALSNTPLHGSAHGSSSNGSAHGRSLGGNGYDGPCRFGLHHKCYRRSGYLHCPSCGEELSEIVSKFKQQWAQGSTTPTEVLGNNRWKNYNREHRTGQEYRSGRLVGTHHQRADEKLNALADKVYSKLMLSE